MPSTIGTGLGGSPVPWGVGTRHKNQGYIIIIFFHKSNKFFLYGHIQCKLLLSVPASVCFSCVFADLSISRLNKA
jgi:hypothetical protein